MRRHRSRSRFPAAPACPLTGRATLTATDSTIKASMLRDIEISCRTIIRFYASLTSV
jgi:hypothetical protein